MHGTSFSHDVLLYRGPDDLIRQAGSLIDEARRDGDIVAVAVPASVATHLRPLLGDDPADTLVEIDHLGRNPGRFIELWADPLASARRAGRGLMGLGQPLWHDRSPEEIDECWISESLFDVAFADASGFHLVCLYDLDVADTDTVAQALQVHDGGTTSHRADPVALLSGSLAPAPTGSMRISVGLEELAALRSRLRATAESSGLDAGRVEDLVLAANELVSNSVRHGGGSGEVTLWTDSGSLWCDVEDGGRIDDPMVGRRRPPEDGVGGRGVWIAHQVCDLVQVRSTASGTHVRIRMCWA
jgi:anti-sigma regulatory factor (Ser/Thr protein kinase)